MKRPESLRLQLLHWVLPPLLVLLAINAYFSDRTAIRTADGAFDRLLIASADAIADQITVRDGLVAVDLPYVALQILESNIQEQVFYRVIASDGSTLIGYDDLPLPPAARSASDESPQTYSAAYQGQTIHLVALRKPVYGLERASTVLVLVAETSESRNALSRSLLVETLGRQAALIVATCALVWFGLGRGLRPVLALRDELLRRSPRDISAIDAGSVQSEVRPLIEALNQHTDRIGRLIDDRQSFLDDASHQMRTPLSEMRMQLEWALRQGDVDLHRETLREVHADVDRMSRLVSQMLVLARSDQELARSQAPAPVDLTTLARETTTDSVPAARKRRIDVSFDGAGRAWVMGNAVLLREMLANLVDNAIGHGRAGGAIVVRVGDGSAPKLEVIDDGPGIPPDERAKVFQRFYRGAASRPGGSGLGLAIAARICRSHGATIHLLDAPAGPGLRVRIEFPATPADASEASQG